AFPFDLLVDELSRSRNRMPSPLLNVMINYEQSISLNKQFSFPGIEVSDLPLSGLTFSKFDLLFDFNDHDDLSIGIEYSLDLFDEDIIKRLSSHFISLITSVCKSPYQRLSSVSLVGEEELLLLRSWNDTTRSYPQVSVSELFRDVSAVYGASQAVYCADRWVSYSDLWKRSSSLAHSLVNKHGVKRGDLVGLYCDRNEWMIVGILGILKSGAAYVPLRRDDPAERISYILSDTKMRLVIEDSEGVWPSGISGVALQSSSMEDVGDFVVETNGEDVGYVMYTSGSTGRPKGVEVLQKGIVRLVRNTNYVSFEESDRVLQLSNFAFDGSTFDIFGALLNGCCL
ncbi:MAG: AMP-binding protein, partial [Flammeovirgaceae bacterium]